MRNILWAVGGGGASAIAGGFTRENFMNEAFTRMTAAEQVLVSSLSLVLFVQPCSLPYLLFSSLVFIFWFEG